MTNETEQILTLIDLLAQEQIPDTQTVEELETIIGHAESHLAMYKQASTLYNLLKCICQQCSLIFFISDSGTLLEAEFSCPVCRTREIKADMNIPDVDLGDDD